MSQEVVLFDLPSKPPCRSWSGNALKTRLALNYKGIPYKTEWIPYIRLQDTLKATGVPPNPQPNWADHTIPTVRLPNGEVVMDSAKIVGKLEDLKPSPSLHLDLGYHQEASDAIGAVFPYFFPLFGAALVRNIVAEEDVDWFNKDRAARFGMSLDELEQKKGGEEAWEAARPGLEKTCEVLRKYKRDQGPFLLGSEPSYGDVIIVAALHMFKLIREEGYQRIVSYGKELKDLYEAAQPWLQRMD